MCCCSAGHDALVFLSLHPHYPAAPHAMCLKQQDSEGTAIAELALRWPAGRPACNPALCVCSSALFAAGHHAALDVFETIVAPAAQRFQPDIILVSAGWVGSRAAIQWMRVEVYSFLVCMAGSCRSCESRAFAALAPAFHRPPPPTPLPLSCRRYDAHWRDPLAGGHSWPRAGLAPMCLHLCSSACSGSTKATAEQHAPLPPVVSHSFLSPLFLPLQACSSVRPPFTPWGRGSSSWLMSSAAAALCSCWRAGGFAFLSFASGLQASS